MDEYIKSKRGKQKFQSGGYIYIFDKYSAGKEKKFYRCEKKHACKARIHVQNGEIVKYINEHSHYPTPAKIERDRVLTQIKQRARDTVESSSIVVNESLQNLSQACQDIMPDNRSLKKMVRRQRNSVSFSNSF